MNNFVYDIPTRVYFGTNQLVNLGKELKRFGTRVLLVYGGGSIKRTGLYDIIVEEINKAGLELYEFSGIEPNYNAGKTSDIEYAEEKEQSEPASDELDDFIDGIF